MLASLIATAILTVSGESGVVRAQDFPVRLTVEGPETACAGETVSYLFRYEILDPNFTGIQFNIGFPRHTTFVSLQSIGGAKGAYRAEGGSDPNRPDTYIWSGEPPSATVEFRVRIDDGFTGLTGAGARVPGTGTTSTNSLTTIVPPCGPVQPTTGEMSESRLTAQGPASACAGDTVAYLFRYEKPNPLLPTLQLNIHAPAHTSLASLRSIEGADGTYESAGFDHPRITDLYVWRGGGPGALVELRVRIDDGFVGVTGAGAAVPGPVDIATNGVLTAVSSCAAALPGTGHGRGGDAPWWAFAGLLSALGLASCARGTVLRRSR